MKLARDRAFWILLVFSIAIRIYSWYATPVIGTDGVAFINIAKLFTDGSIYEGLRQLHHPLYPMLISLGSHIGLDFEVAGRLVSLLFGVLSVITLYVIGKKMFQKDIAFVAAFILCLHPFAVRLSGDVMTDSTYFFFYIAGFGVGYAAITTEKNYLYFLAGVASAFAYLTRPEGISVALITGGWIIIPALKGFYRSRKNENRKTCILKPACHILLLIIGFLIFASPYLLYLKHETGSWKLTNKKQVLQSLEVALMSNQGIDNQNKLLDKAVEKYYFDDKHPLLPANQVETPSDSNVEQPVLDDKYIPFPKITNKRAWDTLAELQSNDKYLKGIYKVIDQYCTSLHYPLVLFLLIGIWSVFRNPINKTACFYLLSFTVLFLFILYLLKISAGYLAQRHLMSVVLVTLFWTSMGINSSYCWIAKKDYGLRVACYVLRIVGYKLHTKSTTRNSQPVTCNPSIINSKGMIIILCLVMLMLLPKALKPHREEKVSRKEAGIWLKNHSNDMPIPIVVLTDRIIIAHYANAHGVQFPYGDYGEIIKFARLKNVDYFAVTEDIKDYCPNFFQEVNDHDMKRILQLKAEDRQVSVYQFINIR